jgi:hypothetical protein
VNLQSDQPRRAVRDSGRRVLFRGPVKTVQHRRVDESSGTVRLYDAALPPGHGRDVNAQDLCEIYET